MAYKLLSRVLSVDIVNKVLEYYGDYYNTCELHMHKIYNVLKIKYINYRKYDITQMDNIKDINDAINEINETKMLSYVNMKICNAWYHCNDVHYIWPKVKSFPRFINETSIWNYIEKNVINCNKCKVIPRLGGYCHNCNFKMCKDNEIFKNC